MSAHDVKRHAAADRVAPLLRRFSVLIALFWLGLAVVTNVFVPQLEKVGEAHNVALSSQIALAAGHQTHWPGVSGIRLRQFGHGRDRGRQAARRRRAPLLRRPGQAVPRHHARGARPGFLGGPADRGRLAEQRRQSSVRPGFLSGNQGEALANDSVDALRASSTRRRPRRGCGPMSPARPHRSPISSRWAIRAPPRSPSSPSA